jgi:hypothetical protein
LPNVPVTACLRVSDWPLQKAGGKPAKAKLFCENEMVYIRGAKNNCLGRTLSSGNVRSNPAVWRFVLLLGSCNEKWDEHVAPKEQTLPHEKPPQHLIAEVQRRQARIELTIGIDFGDVWSDHFTVSRNFDSGSPRSRWEKRYRLNDEFEQHILSLLWGASLRSTSL